MAVVSEEKLSQYDKINMWFYMWLKDIICPRTKQPFALNYRQCTNVQDTDDDGKIIIKDDISKYVFRIETKHFRAYTSKCTLTHDSQIEAWTGLSGATGKYAEYKQVFIICTFTEDWKDHKMGTALDVGEMKVMEYNLNGEWHFPKHNWTVQTFIDHYYEIMNKEEF